MLTGRLELFLLEEPTSEELEPIMLESEPTELESEPITLDLERKELVPPTELELEHTEIT